MPAEELVDVVDSHDHATEVRTLAECKEKGLLHRAVAVLLFDSAGRLLIQRRSIRKDWMAGYWDLSSTGHVKAGESYQEAAVRELREELGVSCRLRIVSKYLAPKFSAGGLTEWEYVSIFEGTHEGDVTPDGVEVEDARFVELGTLIGMISEPSPVLTPDAMATIEEFRRVSGSF
jgi:16S rRNA (adenine1518-N6/adenine1519-N6)-dimethyltransferase